MVAPAHDLAIDRMEVEVLEIIGTCHNLGTARRAVDPRIAGTRIKVAVVVIDERRDIALGILFEHLGPHLKIGLDVLLRGVLVKAIFDGVRLIRVVTAAQIVVLEYPVAETTVEAAGEQADILHPGVPYKLRVAIEREARAMSGYRYGRDLANEFMDTLEGAPKGDIRGAMALLIDKQDDPRRVEVYSALQDLVLAGGR